MSGLLRKCLCGVFAAAAIVAVLSGPTRAGVAQSQRAQIAIALLINVTGVGRAPVPAPAVPVVANVALRAKGSAPSVDSVAGNSTLVAQQTQSAVKVEAEVSPNPAATLLYSNNAAVVMNGNAGTTISQSCAYQVTVHSNIISWTLRDGLSGNPTSSSTSFPGPDVAHNDYQATPKPTSSPFIVYPSAWANVVTASNVQTYCVDLSVTIPLSTPTGAYSTNAVYTLYW
ncbi:MAG TPA: hypothetical protein VFA29_00915 [Candidatus Baltobacteraceae bacterium]|nr:hypothetical protein [Candidatus Baltobacteraceae bacterium]